MTKYNETTGHTLEEAVAAARGGAEIKGSYGNASWWGYNEGWTHILEDGSLCPLPHNFNFRPAGLDGWSIRKAVEVEYEEMSVELSDAIGFIYEGWEAWCQIKHKWHTPKKGDSAVGVSLGNRIHLRRPKPTPPVGEKATTPAPEPVYDLTGQEVIIECTIHHPGWFPARFERSDGQKYHVTPDWRLDSLFENFGGLTRDTKSFRTIDREEPKVEYPLKPMEAWGSYIKTRSGERGGSYLHYERSDGKRHSFPVQGWPGDLFLEAEANGLTFRLLPEGS